MEELYCEKTVKRDMGKKRKIFPVVLITALVIFLYKKWKEGSLFVLNTKIK